MSADNVILQDWKIYCWQVCVCHFQPGNLTLIIAWSGEGVTIYGFFFSAGPNWQSLTLQQFCWKPVPFFHTKWRKFLLLYTQEAMRAIWWEKNVLLIFYQQNILPCHAKMAAKNGNGDTNLCWKLLHTRQKYSDISNLFAKLQHAKAPES